MKLIFIAASIPTLSLAVYTGFNGLAQTPPMGWNSWNSFGCQINETIIRENAKALVDLGLLEAGYEFAVIDDCWQMEERSEDGNLVADPVKFPSGMMALGDYIHSIGLKFGIYSNAGTHTCGGFPGSLGFETQDAKLFASWGVDYLKYDNCYTNGQIGTPNISYQRFKVMSDALIEAGRPIVYSISNWGDDRPWYWAHQISNSYRISGDIYDYFDRKDDQCPCESIIDCKLVGWKCSVTKIIEFASQISAVSAGKGRWLDMDMLEIGNGGMSNREYQVHFTFWCALKSPLILGNKLSKVDEATKNIIMNKELIAISKDPRGKLVMRRWKDEIDGTQMWAGPLSDGFIVILYNISKESKQIIATFDDIFLDDAGKEFYERSYRVVDLWDAERKEVEMSKQISAEVPSHAVKVYRLYF